MTMTTSDTTLTTNDKDDIPPHVVKFCNVKMERQTTKLIKRHVQELQDLMQSRSLSISAIPAKPMEWKDLEIGKMLGRGAFSRVHQVESIHNYDTNKQYAVKTVRPVDNNDSKLQVSVISLALETKWLSVLNYKHIVQMHGHHPDVLEPPKGNMECFVVLERLQGTLEERLKEWKRDETQPQNVWNALVAGLVKNKRRVNDHCVKNDKLKEVPSLESRIQHVALGLAKACEYLHSHCVLYRDLKPQNIGFRSNGDVVLFDFGICKLLDSPHATTSGGRQLTQKAGTFRYMAPENFVGQNYGLPSDVYAFGLVLWSISVCKIPFPNLFTRKEFERQVIRHELRPSCHKLFKNKDKSKQTKQLVQLMQSCWDTQPQNRPTFTQVVQTLEQVVRVVE